MKQRATTVSTCLVAAILALVLALPGPVSADTSRDALMAAVAQFEAVDGNAYTPATYRLAGMERDKALAVLADALATPEAIDAATNALTQAIAALRIRNGSESLWQTYAGYFDLGTIYSGHTNLTAGNARGDMTLAHFNALTGENYMKPDNLMSFTGVFNITPTSNSNADRMCQNALAANKKVHGHVLVWHSQTRSWLHGGTGASTFTRAVARERMEIYIKTVVEHFDTRYPGIVPTWDVVNEAFVDGVGSIPAEANWKNYLRGPTQSAWIKAYTNGMVEGEDPSDFIYDAFVFARRYTPAKLFYNDFNMYQDGKSKLVAMMVRELNARYKSEYPADPRKLIEGVGMQSHNYIQDTPPSSVENGILNLLAADVDLMITELDLFCWFPWNAQPAGGYRDLRDRTTLASITGSNGTTAQRNYWIDLGFTNGSQIEVVQAQVFAEYFRVYKNYAASIDRVTFWGLSDNASWRSGHNPLLWNSDFSPKDAFFAVSDPEGYLGVDPVEVEPLAAPNVAEIVLSYNGITPAYKLGKSSGNLISDVAKAMGPQTRFLGEPQSSWLYGKELSNRAYRRAVFDFLRKQPALAGTILVMPPDTFFVEQME